ncbi:MAG: hypothetical protein J7493_16930 [Porphyrobacter sp.]|nr:hypothetical protein [Porphyrobacter sp.]
MNAGGFWLGGGGCLLLLALSACAPNFQASASSQPCPSESDLEFICGALKPEDLAVIPGGRWLVASGFAPGSGLKLIDTRARTLQRWFTGKSDQVALNQGRYPDCMTPPDPALFNARGISFRETEPGVGEIHVVNHGGRESIEVFAIDSRDPGVPPQLTWRGCLLLPQGNVGNSVATYSDGTVLVTVLTRPGTTITDFVLGQKTGYVLERTPGAPQFRVIEGTELEGNNGLESSKEDDGFYVVAFGPREIVRFDRSGTTGPVWKVTAPEFMPDNIHWHGRHLLTAGMVRDEPGCGGVRQIVDGVADGMQCHRGYVVASLDPASRKWTVVTKSAPSASFNGVSTGVIVNGELWLGSYQSDRVGVRALPVSEKTN